MKKQIFTLLFSVAGICGANAQITLTSYTGTVVNTKDTVKVISSLAPLANVAHTNYLWDETGLTYNAGTSNYPNVPVPGGSGFTSAQYGVASSVFISRSRGLQYSLTDMKAVTPSGVLLYGEYIPRQSLSTSSFTFGANDSVKFPLQSVVYSVPDTILKFPATMGSVWHTTYRSQTKFYLYIALVPFNGDSAVRVSTLTETDSVIGWGKMKVKDMSGSNTGSMDVLQVKKHYQTVDSFYLDNVLAPSTVLTQFGLSQGMVTKAYEVSFYRSGEIFPLLRIGYSDSNYTTASSAESHAQRLQSPAGVASLSLANGAKIYPNPVTNHVFTIDLGDQAAGNWSYELINIDGRRIVTSNIPVSANRTHAQVALPVSLTPGMYYIRLYNDGQQLGVMPVDVTR